MRFNFVISFIFQNGILFCIQEIKRLIEFHDKFFEENDVFILHIFCNKLFLLIVTTALIKSKSTTNCWGTVGTNNILRIRENN